jgi:hypothetical protein
VIALAEIHYSQKTVVAIAEKLFHEKVVAMAEIQLERR